MLRDLDLGLPIHRDCSLWERARVYLSYGWGLLPLLSPGKAPNRELLRLVYRDTRTDHLRIVPASPKEVELWCLLDSNLNLGVFPSQSLCLIDIDHLDMIDPDIRTPTASSGRESGGKHLYLSCDRVLPTRKTSWGHVNPSYLVLPGSLHMTGRVYEWLPGLSPEDVPFMDYREAFPLLGLEVPGDA